MTSSANLSTQLTRAPDELKRLFSSLRSRRDVADLLEIPDSHLVYILYRAPQRYPYRTFEIRKRSGGVRTISAPPTSLAILQAKLNSILQLVYPPKPSAHGFLRGRSIVSNALRHSGKRFVLNVDLKDFFPSINFGRVRGMFMARPYELDPAAATVLAQICCHDNQLPQGAPTSPIVSNMLCARLDSQLQKLARDHKCVYTRYADDLTFSTTLPRFPAELATCQGGWTGSNVVPGTELASLIESNGFRINARKLRLQFRDCHQEVTGLKVNRFPNVSRRFIRQVRAMLHAWDKYGLDAAEREFHDKHDRRSRRAENQGPSFRRVLRGKLDFLKMVKGEGDPTYRRFAGKLHDLDPDLIHVLPEAASPITDGEALRDTAWHHYFEEYKDLVFHLVVRSGGQVNAGTAFAWRPGAVATAAHNLEGEVYLSPPLPEGTPSDPAGFVFHPRRDDDVDIAVIRVPEDALPSGRWIPVRTLPLNPGEQIAALAYPTVPWHEPQLGIYAGLVESTMPRMGGKVDTVQVSIGISGAMSGGPVIDHGGNLVGVVMGTSFENTANGVPGRAFYHILPIRYLLEIDLSRANSQD